MIFVICLILAFTLGIPALLRLGVRLPSTCKCRVTSRKMLNQKDIWPEGWSGLFRQPVGEFKVDSATSLYYRPRGLNRNSMRSSSRLVLVPYLCWG